MSRAPSLLRVLLRAAVTSRWGAGVLSEVRRVELVSAYYGFNRRGPASWQYVPGQLLHLHVLELVYWPAASLHLVGT